MRVYRPEIMRTTRQALNLTAQGGVTFHEAPCEFGIRTVILGGLSLAELSAVH